MALWALPWVRQGAVALAVLAAVLGGLWWLRTDAASDAVKDMAASQAAANREARKVADDAREAVDRAPDGAAVDRLRERGWTRD